MKKHLENHSHKRFNILSGEWVLVSPHRTRRPWLGKHEKGSIPKQRSYEPDCYLCPGNQRANGAVNLKYTSTFVFENDFSALQQDSPDFEINDRLLKAAGEKGVCKVICFSPDHSKSLPDMSISAIGEVISVWQSEYLKLGKLSYINYVQIFENKGNIMGCSNSHPHGQIWAQSSIPNEVEKRDINQKKYFNKNRSGLLEDYLKQELNLKERIIFENEDFVILTPFWAVWPFEAMIVPKIPQAHIGLMTQKQKTAFAEAIKILTSCYDKLFNCSFPYSAGINQALANGEENKHWHWEMSFYPPLLRSSTIKKFMVGYEMFAMPQRDFTTEYAAERLRILVNAKKGIDHE